MMEMRLGLFLPQMGGDVGGRVQIKLDGAQEYGRLAAAGQAAVAVVSGQVRDYGYLGDVSLLALEHYPGMTKRVLTEIGNSVTARFVIQLADCSPVWPLKGWRCHFMSGFHRTSP